MTFVLDLYCPEATMTPARIQLLQRSQALVLRLQKLESRERRIQRSQQELQKLQVIHEDIDKATAQLCSMYERLFDLQQTMATNLLHGRITRDAARCQVQTYRSLMDEIKRRYIAHQNKRHDLEAEMKPIQDFIWDEEEKDKLEEEYLEFTQPVVPRIPE